ncbi:LysR family transcriptional regulator [Streptomyces canus]|uniref:LysR family transcriptional regulator n=1 Tax=Streptomyces canus TaxID=58343 RepID=UPI003713FE2A
MASVFVDFTREPRLDAERRVTLFGRRGGVGQGIAGTWAFVAVAEKGGLSAAARRLHMSQPALSQTISGLERHLGVRLLVRGSTGVRATDAGTALLGEARAVLAQHDQALRVRARTGPLCAWPGRLAGRAPDLS